MRCAIVCICVGIAGGALISDVGFALKSSATGIIVFAVLSLAARALDVWLVIQRLLICLLLFLFGLFWHLHWASIILAERLPRVLEGETLRVIGVVTGLPEKSLIAQQFQFKILHSDSGFSPRRVVLNYYGESTISPGQYWEFSVRLNRPHGFSNPAGFDYEGWLFQRRVSARGYVRPSPSERLIAQLPGVISISLVDSFQVRLHSLRYAIKAQLERLLGDAPNSGLLLALLIGDRAGISQDSWSLFTATGSNHLFVISGLHIGMISTFCFWLTLTLGKSLGIAGLVPVHKAAALVALVAALFYSMLAGFSLPTQRAFIMIAVLICGLFWNASYLVSFRLLVALLAVLLLNPLAVINSGFWMSFTAVTALITFSRASLLSAHTGSDLLPMSERIRLFAVNYVRPQLVVFAALAVPLLFFTQQLSLLSPLANIIAIPIVGFLVVPVGFIAVLLTFINEGAATLFLSFAHGVINLLLIFLNYLVQSGAGLLFLQLAQPSVWQLLALMLAMLLLLLPGAVCRKSLMLPLVLCLVPLPSIFRQSATQEKYLKLHVLDVGQGLAVIVETQDRILLFDTGASLSPDFNIGSAVIAPVLRSLGVSKVDVAVISHSDNDHAGGLSGVLSNIPVSRLISNRKQLAGNVQAELCHDAMAWKWDEIEFIFLQTTIDFEQENNNSCVLQVRFNGLRVLLPGDIERAAEKQLVRKYARELASTILVAPHHGSLSSSSYAFLKQVKPNFVVFSAGYRNSFGHPHDEVRSRYDEFGSRALSTADSGMISFDFGSMKQGDGEIAEIHRYRKQNFRYWH